MSSTPTLPPRHVRSAPSPRRRTSPRAAAGYSALELLVSILVLSVLLSGLYVVLFQAQTVFEAELDDMELRQQARVTISRLATELRMAGYGTGNLPEALPFAGPTRLVFAADIDDGSPNLPCDAAIEDAVDGGAERFTYRVRNDELLRSVDCWNGANWTSEYSDQVVVQGLRRGAAVFRYFDGDGVELSTGPGGTLSAANRALVRTVSVWLELEDPDSAVPYRPTPEFRVATQVRLRNRGR